MEEASRQKSRIKSFFAHADLNRNDHNPNPIMIELPSSFINRTSRLLGDDYPRFEQALGEESPVSIRLNPAKSRPTEAMGETVPWSQWGYYLPERPAFTFDPCFHAGAYYVQEAASMFLHRVIDQYIHTPVRYLDLCAAPGGKSTDAIASLPAGSLVVSNEVIPNRAYILAENMVKWGSPFSIVTRNEAADFARLDGYFDVIATDVPCSGEGMFRKDPDAITEWSPDSVARCAGRQRQILTEVWQALRPGGLLIYSTCTYNTEENEEMILFLMKEMGATPLTVETDPAWGITPALMPEVTAYRFMPHLTRGEGLFMAVLQKPGEPDESRRSQLLDEPTGKRNKKGKGATPMPPVPDEWRERLACPDNFAFVSHDNTFLAIPREYQADYRLLDRHLTLLHAGVTLATAKGRDYLPHISLALSTALQPDKTVCYEADLPTALAYLRRESIVLPSDLPRGYLIVTYRGFPLGWVKNLGNRANNLYPQEWRIRSGYTPDSLPHLPIESI